MTDPTAAHVTRFRVRYSETDQMHSYHHSRVLEWFGCGRTELIRSRGMTYREMESRGVMLPVTLAHIEYTGKAEYDDELEMAVRASMPSRARLRFDVEIRRVDTGQAVCTGHTIHAVTNREGRPIRPPSWLVELMRETH